MVTAIAEIDHLRLLFATLLNGPCCSAWCAGNVLVSLVNHIAFSKANQEDDFQNFN